MISNRENDSHVEREIAKFLDEHLYSNKEIFKEFVRTDGRDEQISGSDLVLSTSDGKLDRVVVDEKVAARYANTKLNSFALELSFIGRDGKRKNGWFTDYAKTTQYYLLGWIDKANIQYLTEHKRYDTDAITQDNIETIEWALVSRQKIMNFLEGKGWTLDKLARQDSKIRENGKVATNEFINGVGFRYSNGYVEKPINILLERKSYIEISDYHGIINVQQKPNEEMRKITLESKIVNDNYTQYIYDNYDIQNREKTITEVPIPSKEDMEAMKNDDWNILLICGKSGSGKSTILKQIYGDVKPIEYDYSRCVISQFPRMTEEEVCDLLQSIGLSSVPTWLRKPQELSNGERARLDIAKAIYDANGGTVVLDEYTSVVNRAAAKSMSHALQRYARQNGLKIIIASCHFDIVEWLQADYMFNLEHRDENGEVEMEKMVYSDNTNYNVYQSPRDIDILTEAVEIP